MKNTRLGRRCAVRLATAAVALTAAFMLAVMPAAAATINATDVTIRNTAEDKSDYSNAIGVLNTGDKVTVISKTTDGSGIEWYYIELENGNRGYVKAQWVDNGGEAVAEEEPAPAAEETPEVNEEDVVDEEDIIDEEDVVNDDDWAGDPADLAEGTPASGDGTATAVTDADSQDAPEVENGQEYDPYTDPNAQYGINFSSEEDGTGSWYVYNYDTDKKIRIGDLEKLSDAQNAAQKNASAAGMWRTIACILLILLVALIIFLYLTLRRNSGPSPSARRRAQRRAAREEEDEEDDFSDWDEDEDTDDGSAGADEADVTAAADDAEADDASAEEDDFEEDADDLAEDEEEEPAPRKKSGGLFGGGKSGGRRSALFARAEEEDEEEDEEDDSYDEDDDSYDEEEDDDFYDDDSYDDEDEDEDEDEAPRKGGFFSMLKNIFSSDGLDDDYDDEDEDEDEEYEDDEYEDEEEEEELPPVRKQSRQSRRSSEKTEPAPRRRNRPAPKIEFDEEADYPEDVDLIPAAGKAVREEAAAVEEAAVEAEEATVEAAKAAVRKKNASANALRQPAPADLVDEDEDDDFYADDDDDMEYSFLNSSKRSSRK